MRYTDLSENHIAFYALHYQIIFYIASLLMMFVLFSPLYICLQGSKTNNPLASKLGIYVSATILVGEIFRVVNFYEMYYNSSRALAFFGACDNIISCFLLLFLIVYFWGRIRAIETGLHNSRSFSNMEAAHHNADLSQKEDYPDTLDELYVKKLLKKNPLVKRRNIFSRCCGLIFNYQNDTYQKFPTRLLVMITLAFCLIYQFFISSFIAVVHNTEPAMCSTAESFSALRIMLESYLSLRTKPLGEDLTRSFPGGFIAAGITFDLGNIEDIVTFARNQQQYNIEAFTLTSFIVWFFILRKFRSYFITFRKDLSRLRKGDKSFIPK